MTTVISLPAQQKYFYRLLMTSIIILIGCSLFVAIGFLLSFIWAVKNGQYDDTYTPSLRMLFEDEPAQEIPGKSIDPAVHKEPSEKSLPANSKS